MAFALKIALGLFLGGGIGYLASRVLCLAGSCPITSNRPLMVAMGGMLGVWLVVSGCTKSRPKEDTPFGTDLVSPEEYQAKVIDSKTPALVDFHATWCPPCHQLAPILAKLERRYSGKVAFFRVDVDEALKLAQKHDIQFLPTLILYRGGQKVERLEGFRGESELRQQLDRLLATTTAQQESDG